jgi:hypothetical protein
LATTPSYERVDYRLRPNKAVERKMLCEALRRLSHFGSLAKYSYVGFASPFYSDFLLFHKALGLRDMVNVERETRDAKRMEFNRPFGAIRCLFGSSAKILPGLAWSSKAIVWLDYDGELDAEVLEDLGTVCSRAQPGSFLVASFRAEWTNEDWSGALSDLKRRFGSRMPTEVVLKGKTVPLTRKTAGEGGYSRALARVAFAEMEKVCRDRSGGGRGFRFHQVLHFEYSDGTKMVTVGGVILADDQDAVLASCDFGSLDFVRTAGSEPYVLKLPKLTHRETRYLDQNLPLRKETWERIGLKEAWARRYEEVYRWYPTFAETEL